MSKVLLDNWELSTCAMVKLGASKKNFDLWGHGHYSYYDNDRIDKAVDICWQNLLTCIVLWDDIYLNYHDYNELYYFHRSRSLEKRYVNKLHSFITSSSEDPMFLHYLDRDSIPEWSPQYEDLKMLYERIGHNDRISREEIFLLLRGYNYLIESNLLGYNYLPHPRRAELLYNSGIFQKGFDRKLYLDELDKGVKDFIDRVNELSNYQLKIVHFPVLYKFIHENSKNPEEELLMALSLRREKDVIKFRESLSTIEIELENGNYLGYAASIERVKEICDDITAKMYKKPISFEMSLALSPAINLGLEPQCRVKSKLHTTFLQKLANYSLTGKFVKEVF